MTFKINDENIPFRETVKYLGVLFDGKWNFVGHVNYAISKANAAYHMACNLVRQKYLSVGVKLLVYKMLVRPTLCHAFPCWNSLSSHQMERVRANERRWLRCLLRIRRGPNGRLISNKRLYAKVKIPRMDAYLVRLNFKFLDRLSLSDCESVKSCLAEFSPNAKFKGPADLLGGLRQGRVYDGNGNLLLFHHRAYNKPGIIYNLAQ
jgi:hypothetical protein